MSNNDVIQAIGENSSYQYLVMLQIDCLRHQTIMDKVNQEYTRRTKILKSKLNLGNLIMVRRHGQYLYTDIVKGVIGWAQEDLLRMDRRMCKLLTLYGRYTQERVLSFVCVTSWRRARSHEYRGCFEAQGTEFKRLHGNKQWWDHTSSKRSHKKRKRSWYQVDIEVNTRD